MLTAGLILRTHRSMSKKRNQRKKDVHARSSQYHFLASMFLLETKMEMN